MDRALRSDRKLGDLSSTKIHRGGGAEIGPVSVTTVPAGPLVGERVARLKLGAEVGAKGMFTAHAGSA